MSTKKKNELMIDERFDVRPKAKPDEAVKGRLLKWKDSYKNEGDKENSYSLHLNVDGSEKDPAGALMEKAANILKPYLKEEPKVDARNFLEDSPELQVWHRKKKGQLCAFLTIDSNLPKEQMSGRLFRLSSEINKIIDNNKFKS